jgi:dipeptidyl aminopeptidase/acylaminoacyl peptidase
MEQIKLDHWLKFKFIGNLKSSPNNKRISYSVTSTNLKKDNYESNIWIMDENRNYQLTGMNQESKSIWLDDETILFSSARLKEETTYPKTDFYKISVNGGEAIKAFTIPLAVGSIKKLDDKKYIISASTDMRYPNLYKESEKKLEKHATKLKEEEFATEINEIPFYSNGQDFTVYERNRLFLFDESDNKLTALTTNNFNVAQFEIDENNHCVLFMGQTFKMVEKLDSEIYSLDLKDLSIKQLSHAKYFLYGFKQLKNSIIVLAHDGKLLGLNENQRLYDLNEQGTFDLVFNPYYSIGNSIGSDIRLQGSELLQVFNDKLYFTLTVEDHSRLLTLDEEGVIESLWDAPGSIDGFGYCGSKLYTVGLFNQDAQDIFLLENNSITNTSKFNINVFEDNYLAKPIKLSVIKENHSVDGWVLLPNEYDATKKYPAILDIHGGPKTVYGEVYYHEMQVWANNGYIVMFCNPRGSDGKGNDFSDIRGKYGTIDYVDLMDFVDVVIEKYSIDKNRLGVTGGSYGGFMTNWIIGHTHRFKCAATQRSISNWLSFYGTSDIGYYFALDQSATQFKSDKDFEKLWFHSPLKYINFIKTPTLIIHSSKDYRCPVEQGYQLLTALKHNKVESKMVLFHNETHELSRSGKPKARMLRLKEISTWMDQYLIK